MAMLRDGSAASLHPFVTGHVEPGARVVTDGWQGYRGIERLGYTHEPRSQRAALARGDDLGELLPAVHRVASLAKRWLLGTHQGSVQHAHLQSYLDEFVFRFNRRGSRSQGLVVYRVLELAVAHDSVRYRDLVTGPAAQADPAHTTRQTRPPAQHRPPPGGSTMENSLNWLVRSDEYPYGANASPGARAYYDQQRRRGLSHHAALRQLANRLVGIPHGCLKTRTCYDEAIARPATANEDQQVAA